MTNTNSKDTITKEQIAAGIKAVAAVAEAICELGTVPDGVLYANLMSRLSLSEYQAIIEMLVKAELVTNNAHELRWIGGNPIGFNITHCMLKPPKE